jgi:Flp pilus assembly protein TadG
MISTTKTRGNRPLVGKHQRGAAAVEFALVLPILLMVLLGIIDFGLYFYNDLQLTHAARDAARYLSVGDSIGAEAAIAEAEDRLVATSSPSVSLTPGSQGEETTVTVTATYNFITPLPTLVGIGSTININASAVMRRE